MSNWGRIQLNRINWFLKELVLTWGSQPSLFSSKRIERSILFAASVSIICFFVYHKRNTIDALEVMGFVTLMGGWAGFNVLQTQKEKREDKLDTNTENIVNESLHKEPKI